LGFSLVEGTAKRPQTLMDEMATETETVLEQPPRELRVVVVGD